MCLIFCKLIIMHTKFDFMAVSLKLSSVIWQLTVIALGFPLFLFISVIYTVLLLKLTEVSCKVQF